MPYSPPSGSAANFQTGYVDFPRPYNGVRSKFPASSYTPPSAGSVSAQFPASVADWMPPAGGSANFSVVTVDPVTGTGSATVDVSASGTGSITVPAVVGAGDVAVDMSADGTGAVGVAGVGAASVDIDSIGAAAHGVAGQGAASIDVASDGSGLVVRYELAGEVRLSGILVNRLVRAYRRDTGELVGEQTTTGGKFRIHTGFTAREHYLVPIDTAEDATDWLPPCANRVVSVLAQDPA